MSKKNCPDNVGTIFHHGVYMKNYWASINDLLPPQSDCFFLFTFSWHDKKTIIMPFEKIVEN